MTEFIVGRMNVQNLTEGQIIEHEGGSVLVLALELCLSDTAHDTGHFGLYELVGLNETGVMVSLYFPKDTKLSIF